MSVLRPFQLIGDSAPRPPIYWVPPVAAVLASAWAASWAYPPINPASLSFGLLWVVAAKFVLKVLLAGMVIAFAMYGVLRRTAGAGGAAILRITACTVWFAPLAVFLIEQSMWAPGVAGLAALSMIRRFRSYHARASGEAPPEVPEIQKPRDILRVPDSPPLLRQMLPALIASLCAQAAILEGIAGNIAMLAVFSGIGVGIVRWRRASQPPRMIGWTRSIVSTVGVLMLAILITAGGLLRYLDIKPGSGGASFLQALLSTGTGDEARPQRGHTTHNTGSEEEGVFDGAYRGVILWPEAQPHTVLVPPLPAMKHDLFAKNSSDPLSIPFFGVYYLFQPPHRRPPGNSVTARGSPTRLSYRSTGGIPMMMEAHQNFGTLIDLSCCSRIQVVISNGDPHSDTVALELILSNTALKGRPSVSLGRVPVKSRLVWNAYDDRSPVREVVSFAMSASSSIRQFDEATVVYRLRPWRADHSARIAVERFVLIPRGR